MFSPARLRQPAVGDLCAAEVEEAEFGEVLQVHQAGGGDLRSAENETCEVGQPAQIRQPNVRDPGTGQVEER